MQISLYLLCFLQFGEFKSANKLIFTVFFCNLERLGPAFSLYLLCFLQFCDQSGPRGRGREGRHPLEELGRRMRRRRRRRRRRRKEEEEEKEEEEGGGGGRKTKRKRRRRRTGGVGRGKKCK